MARMTLGALCREAREKHGLSQEQAGYLTGYARRTVSDLERDERTESQFDYICRLACKLDDLDLLRRAIQIQTGIPIAGMPLPEDLDRHFAALRDLTLHKIEQAVAALRSVASWKLGPDQRDLLEETARKVLDAKRAADWTYDALCAAGGIDPDELMKSHRLSVAA